MQNLQEIQDKIFFESKHILETLSKINSREELLSKHDLFSEITDRIAFLRILEKNKDSFSEEVSLQITNEEYHDFTHKPLLNSDEESLEDNILEEDIIEEEVIFTNEINEMDDEDHHNSEIKNESKVTIIEEISTFTEKEELNYEERVSQKEKEFLELEERRRKIVEFNKEDVIHPPKDEYTEESKNSSSTGEKKFKLASIRGLKVVQNIFDDDPLEKIEQQEGEKKPELGSVMKTNIPTDFMEAEKRKPEFRLDLNDKVTFTKFLFNGNADELKKTIDQLNSYQKLDDAKQYLSEVYYTKDWRKVDEYAQRLWSLVENKFM